MEKRSKSETTFSHQSSGSRIFALFKDRMAAEMALSELRQFGFTENEIGVVGLADTNPNDVSGLREDYSRPPFGVGEEHAEYNDLAGMGLDATQSRNYYSRLSAGGVLVTVRADDQRSSEARRILQKFGADINPPVNIEGQSGTATMKPEAGTQSFDLRGEALRTSREQNKRGVGVSNDKKKDYDAEPESNIKKPAA
jgi:hypothetical protein